MSRSHTSSRGGITYHHAGAFWVGVAAVTGGVILHLPMYLEAREMNYVLEGMAVDGHMLAGMVMIVAGVAATAYGLLPRRQPRGRAGSSGLRIQALDDAPITRAHVALLLVMAAAITIDVMKPVTLGFVAPGMAREYGLKSPVNPDGSVPVALLPLSGITGMVIGSFVWGWLGDRIGRRASILLAGVLFVGTAVCGTMPSYQLNFVMCFLMGLGVGGMLPITFALMAETIPARHRGWLMVLIGGDVAGAYLITSWLSSELTPEFGWRILWLLGLPTGVLLLMLNRWILSTRRRFRTQAARGLRHPPAGCTEPAGSTSPVTVPSPTPSTTTRAAGATCGGPTRARATVSGGGSPRSSSGAAPTTSPTSACVAAPRLPRLRRLRPRRHPRRRTPVPSPRPRPGCRCRSPCGEADRRSPRRVATARYGHPLRVSGRLLGDGDAPIAGGAVCAAAADGVGGAAAQPIASLVTDSAGRFDYKLPRGPSRRVWFVYRAGGTSAVASVVTRVRAPVRLRPSRRSLRNGETVVLRGQVGADVPLAGALLELQARLARGWRTFATTRSGRAGRFRYAYRFTRTVGVQRYALRARFPRQRGYPFAAGGSRPVQLRASGP